MTDDVFLELTSVIVSSYVAQNTLGPDELPALIKLVHSTLANIEAPEVAATPNPTKVTPAQIKKSLADPTALISFIDNRRYKLLKRHLAANGMTVEEYKQRFGLPKNYPTTASGYSAQRSAMAKSLGFGRTRRVAEPSAPKKPVGRPKKTT